jgi:hypothetical protein
LLDDEEDELLDEDELFEELLEDDGPSDPCPPQAARLATSVAK